jgi:hypothetical protein
VIHASQIGELGAQEGTVVLGHYTRPFMMGGTQVGMVDTLGTVLEPAASQLGGTTLTGLAPDLAVIGPRLQAAPRLIFFTGSGMRGLTAAEMQMIQSNPALHSKTIFVFGGM